MSNIGLNTNTFRITGKYLDILTDFIVKAKVNHEISDAKKDQLIEFISKIIDGENTQPQFQLLSSIIDRELRNQHSKREVFFSGLLQEIKNSNVDEVLPKIEFIVEALDSENSDALSKIKGE
jgi:hypothetical protein